MSLSNTLRQSVVPTNATFGSQSQDLFAGLSDPLVATNTALTHTSNSPPSAGADAETLLNAIFRRNGTKGLSVEDVHELIRGYPSPSAATVAPVHSITRNLLLYLE